MTKMTPLKGTTPAQWRVVWTGDASREATISWTTAEPGKKHVVYYGPESGGKGGELALSQECQSNGVYSIKQPEPPDISMAPVLRLCSMACTCRGPGS